MSKHILQLLFLLAVLILGSSLTSTGLASGKQETRDSLHNPEASSEIILRFGGDCMLGGHYEQAVGDDLAFVFDGFDILRSADIAMVNLECPVTLHGKKVPKPFNFRMRPGFLQVLKDAGIDVVNIANNHIYDYGEVGLFDTIAYLDSVGIGHVGAGRNRTEAHRPYIANVWGKRLGFLGYYGGGESPVATQRAGVAKRDIELIQSDILALKEKDSADFVVVNIHWGTEKADTPETWQVQLAHQIIDAGANAVIGHHPHVLQGIEKYKSGVIVYSLGNLVFGGNHRSNYTTGLFEIRLKNHHPEYRFIPVIIENWKAMGLTGAAGDSVIQHVRELSGIFPESIFTNKERK